MSIISRSLTAVVRYVAEEQFQGGIDARSNIKNEVSVSMLTESRACGVGEDSGSGVGRDGRKGLEDLLWGCHGARVNE